VKCIFIDYGIGVKGYKLCNLMNGKVLYRRNIIFREVNYSPTVMHPEEDEKLVVQQPPKNKKFEPKNKK
jgi:hypothetical protein